MKIIIHKNFDEIKNTHKKKRNQLINITVVLLFGIYCINESDTILSIMGGLMIAAGSLPLFLWYIVPAIFFLGSKVIHKLRRRTTMFDNSKLDKKT